MDVSGLYHQHWSRLCGAGTMCRALEVSFPLKSDGPADGGRNSNIHHNKIVISGVYIYSDNPHVASLHKITSHRGR